MLKRKWLIALAGAVSVVAIVGAGAVMAQEGGAGSSPTFLDRVAAKLGIERAQLDEAIDEARSDELDEAVSAGEITEEQADRLRERFESGSGDNTPFLLPGYRDGAPGGEGDDLPFELPLPEGDDGGFGFSLPFGAELSGLGDEFAAFLGITPEQLREDLSAEDATLASVAEAHGKSRDEVKTFATDRVGEKLDEAVADGHIPQSIADMVLEGTDMAIEAALDAPVGNIWGKLERSFGSGDDSDSEQDGESRGPSRS